MSSTYKLPESNEKAIALVWKQFLKEFPTEKECFKELDRRVRSGRSHKCGSCGNVQLDEGKSYRVLRCRRCKTKLWITGGGFFHRMRLAKPWLARIWLMERGVAISSSRFAKLAGIASSTALTMFKKLTIVIEDAMGGESVPSSVFCELLLKRSRETPKRVHPVSEQEELEREMQEGSEERGEREDKEESDNGSLECFEDKDWQLSVQVESEPRADAMTAARERGLIGQEKAVYEVLCREPVQFDDLSKGTGTKVPELSATLVMLELEGYVKRLPGDRYIRVDSDVAEQRQGNFSGKDLTAPTTNKVAGIIEFVRETFHGISRKYLQNYLAAYWCQMDRVRWKLGSLLEACVQFRYIGYGEILQYVSPYMVTVA